MLPPSAALLTPEKKATANPTYTPAKGQDYKPGYYPAMPSGCRSPSSLPSLLPIRQLECPPPSRSLAEQKINVTGGAIEGKLCRDIVLTRVEIRNSYIANCTLINCITKGCYFTGTKMIGSDIVNSPCVISCSFEDSFISLSILSNCLMIQGAVKESRVMDSSFEAAGVFYCRLTRSSFYQCEYKEIEQVDCDLKECDGNGDVDAFFPLVVPKTTTRESTGLVQRARSKTTEAQKESDRVSLPPIQAPVFQPQNAKAVVNATTTTTTTTTAPNTGAAFNEYYQNQEGKVGAPGRNRRGSLFCCQ
eukprot:GILJ01014718.1.p1 GENE.GILJ01014718.1~~GILJ01014718.1.p1  ORF type:complete len:304 (-),score=48.08 GILJ01014718.1:457-1368(-)